MKYFSILILIFSFKAFAVNLVEPSAKDLGKDVIKAMVGYSKDFTPLKIENFLSDIREMMESPMLAIADYNGDGIKDVAVLGVNLKIRKTEIIAFISNKKLQKFDPIKVESFDFNPDIMSEGDTYLSTAKPAILKASKRAALQIEFFDGTSGMVDSYFYSLSKRKFKILSDMVKID